MADVTSRGGKMSPRGNCKGNINEGWLSADDPAATLMAPSEVRQAETPLALTSLPVLSSILLFIFL